MITKNFTIPLTDEPYVDTTALNRTHAATYTGPRYLKIVIDSETKYVERIVSGADTLDEINNMFVAQEPEKTYAILDANTHTFEAAYLSGLYNTGVVENYTETLPTQDAEGVDETWEYGWDDNTGMILQQYMGRDLKFVNGSYVRPRFRVHALTRQSFLESLIVQATAIEAAIESNESLSDADIAQLETYVTWLRNVPTKYANVKHWKIPFKITVPIY
jgi:hypothetical protein